MLTAIVRGRAYWADVPPAVWRQILTILTAIAPTLIMLLRRCGDRLHHRLGWVWAGSLVLTALLSFGSRTRVDFV